MCLSLHPHGCVVPVVVEADNYPNDALSLARIKKLADDEGLFADPTIVEPCVVVPTELDMLEGLAENLGQEPSELLIAWKALPQRVTLRNFLLHTFGRGPGIYRSTRITSRVVDAYGELEGRFPSV